MKDHPPMKRFSPVSTQSGLSLIEVLVSVLVLGVGLLGIAAMQALALRGGQGSLETSQAVMASTSIIEAMRANRDNAADYNMGSAANPICAAGSVAGASLASNDKRAWIQSLKGSLGDDVNTCGAIVGCPGACVITVQWNDSRADKAVGNEKRQLETGTTI